MTPHRPAESWQVRAAARRGQPKAIPRYQQGSRECPWIPWATHGPDSRSTSDLPGA